MRQLEEPDLADRLLEILGESGLAPEALELELTESGLMANVDRAIAIMETLAASGVTWSIDDFGTGYSSLIYLKRFPATKVKIDKSFVRDMLTDPNDYAIVSAIVAMGHNLGLKAVAEGVEIADQAESLRQLGCDLAQGFHFAYPYPASRLLRPHANPLGG